MRPSMPASCKIANDGAELEIPTTRAGAKRLRNLQPLGFRAGDENLYRYVGNSPTNAVDPWGLEAEKIVGKVTEILPEKKPKPLKDLIDKIPEAPELPRRPLPPNVIDCMANQAFQGKPGPGQAAGVPNVFGCTAVIVVPPKTPWFGVHVGPGRTPVKDIADKIKDADPKSACYIIFNPKVLTGPALQTLEEMLRKTDRFTNRTLILCDGHVYVSVDGLPFRPK